MKQNARIIKNDEGKFIAHIDRPSACKNCGACKGQDFTVELEDDAREGSCQIEMRDGRVLLASFIAYGIPLLFFVIGIVLGYPISNALVLPGSPDLWAAGLGFLLMALSFAIIRALLPWMQRKKLFSHTVDMDA